MDSKEYLDKLKWLDRLIDTKATGTPKNLARKLECSESSVYRKIEDLRSFGFTIEYDTERRTYYYPDGREPPFKFTIGPNKSQ